MNEKRLQRLRELMAEKHLDAIVVSKPENRLYFSGFTGSAGVLLVSQTSAQLLTDFRYMEQATTQAQQYEILQIGGTAGQRLYEVLAQQCARQQLTTVGFESDYVTFAVYQQLTEALGQQTLTPLTLDVLRMVKDEQELTCIRKAVEIADQAFSHIVTFLRPGISEIAVAAELEFTMRRLGSEKPAFSTIVASGVRGALPHGQATDKLLAAGELITMDFGAVYQGYCSDITRTVMLGKADTRQKEMYQLVLQAQLAGLAAVAAGKTGQEVDAVSRRLLTEAGYGEYFGHGLGHGLGLAIHEEPRLSPSAPPVNLAERMVVTVEPGVYLPDWGGIRIEDTVVVCAAGCEVLTASSKQFIEIV